MSLAAFLAGTALLLSVHQQPHQLLAVLNWLVAILAAAPLVQQGCLAYGLPSGSDAARRWVN